jgi:hypothetical protein
MPCLPLSSLTGTSSTAPTPPEGLFLYQLLHIFRILRYVCLPLMGILHHDSILFSTLLWSKGVWHHRLFVTLDFMCWKSIETYALFSFIVLCEANTLLLAHYALYYLRKHQLLSHILGSRLILRFSSLIISRNVVCFKLYLLSFSGLTTRNMSAYDLLVMTMDKIVIDLWRICSKWS